MQGFQCGGVNGTASSLIPATASSNDVMKSCDLQAAFISTSHLPSTHIMGDRRMAATVTASCPHSSGVAAAASALNRLTTAEAAPRIANPIVRNHLVVRSVDEFASLMICVIADITLTWHPQSAAQRAFRLRAKSSLTVSNFLSLWLRTTAAILFTLSIFLGGGVATTTERLPWRCRGFVSTASRQSVHKPKANIAPTRTTTYVEGCRFAINRLCFFIRKGGCWTSI